MSRSERLLALMNLLRQYRRPVTAATLAEKLGVSSRSIYRDIATLQYQGADIAGEAGKGYLLSPGHYLPPMNLTEDELDALVLGARWVIAEADTELAGAARSLLGKLAAVLPENAREQLHGNTLMQVPRAAGSGSVSGHFMPEIRRAIRRGQKLKIEYQTREAHSVRIIWPFAAGFFEKAQVVVAWCEKRKAFRHFRADRILQLTTLEEPYPNHRSQLLKQWQQENKINLPLC